MYHSNDILDIGLDGINKDFDYFYCMGTDIAGDIGKEQLVAANNEIKVVFNGKIPGTSITKGQNTLSNQAYRLKEILFISMQSAMEI